MIPLQICAAHLRTPRFGEVNGSRSGLSGLFCFSQEVFGPGQRPGFRKLPSRP